MTGSPVSVLRMSDGLPASDSDDRTAWRSSAPVPLSAPSMVWALARARRDTDSSRWSISVVRVTVSVVMASTTDRSSVTSATAMAMRARSPRWNPWPGGGPAARSSVMSRQGCSL